MVPETVGAKTLIKVVGMTKATKVAHGSLFSGEDTARLGGIKPYTGHKNETEKQ